MRKYPKENWERLGGLVNTLRLQAGYADTVEWAAKVGRSTRILLGLERGEPVGAKTLDAVADALGVASFSFHNVLAGADEVAHEQDVWRAMRNYEDEGGSVDWPLRSFSDEALLAEVGRRMAAHSDGQSRAVFAAREGGEEHDRSPATIKPAPEPADQSGPLAADRQASAIDSEHEEPTEP